jgi:hypothetical protein
MATNRSPFSAFLRLLRLFAANRPHGLLPSLSSRVFPSQETWAILAVAFAFALFVN